MARAHGVLRDMDGFKARLSGWRTQHGSGFHDDERYALTQLTRLDPARRTCRKAE